MNNNNTIINVYNNTINMKKFMMSQEELKEMLYSEGLINMATFAEGEDSDEVVFDFTKYIGVAPFNVQAINPTLDEIKTFIPDYAGQEPNYHVDLDTGKRAIRISIWLKLDKNHDTTMKIVEGKEGEMYFNASFMVGEDYAYNHDKTKVQVINHYGDTTWVEVGMVKGQELPEYAKRNGFNLPYRPAHIGEELLVDTIKKYRVIPITKKYVDGQYISKTEEELKSCIMYFEEADITKLISGDVSGIKNAFFSKPDNKIKYLLAVRMSDDNKSYQDVIARFPLGFRTRKFDRLRKDLASAVENGAFGNRDFGGDITKDDYDMEFREFVSQPTDFKENNSSENSPLPWD